MFTIKNITYGEILIAHPCCTPLLDIQINLIHNSFPISWFAPAGEKAIILNCPESDIIHSQFRLKPIGSDPVVVWASKVMLRER